MPPNLFGIGAGSNANNNPMNPMASSMPRPNPMPRQDSPINTNAMPSFLNPNMDNKPKETKPSFDVDELVKKIDAKIAELEKEEAMNKQKQQQQQQQQSSIPKPIKDISPVKEVVTPKKEEPKKQVDLKLDDEDDDDFFDDFFDE